MARLTVPDVEDLANFSGRDESSYEIFAEEALKQATLLFELSSCLDSLPSFGSPDYELCRNAILEMADKLYLGQLYAKAKASPFQSETIGSYSYSKAAQLISSGLPTGLLWFDMAIQKLGVCEHLPSIQYSSTSIFENDGVYVTPAGDKFLPGPEGKNKDVFDATISRN